MKNNTAMIVIIVLAAFLRFWNLGQNPPALYWDEASLGYNAYSILTAGKDEHGEYLPVTRFIAFGDYKPPGYIYATVPFIALLGLTEFSIRSASALAGTLTVLVTYLLAKLIFKKNHWSLHIGQWSVSLAVIAAFLLAVSPWHLQFSRGAFEANVATLFSTAGIYFFLRGIKNGKYLLPSAILFVLSMYTFNTHRVFVPLLVLGLSLLYRKYLSAHLRWIIASAIVGLIILSPLIPFMVSREGKLRFEEVTIFNNLEPIEVANNRIEQEGNSFLARLQHNRRLQFARDFALHYVDHFKGSFLFISGDVNPRLGTRENGVLYPIELPLLIIGIYVLLRRKRETALLLFLWILIGLIPAGTARETPHALRTLNILPAPQILVAIGIVSGCSWIKQKRLYLSVLIISYSLLITSYLHTYHSHYPRQWAASWQYGYKQLVQEVTKIEDDYDKIFITRTYGRPYIYFLLYQQYDPEAYWTQRNAERDWFGFWTVNGFGKYIFGNHPSLEERGEERWLIVSGPDGLPAEGRKLSEITFPNGELSFEIGEL